MRMASETSYKGFSKTIWNDTGRWFVPNLMNNIITFALDEQLQQWTSSWQSSDKVIIIIDGKKITMNRVCVGYDKRYVAQAMEFFQDFEEFFKLSPSCHRKSPKLSIKLEKKKKSAYTHTHILLPSSTTEGTPKRHQLKYYNQAHVQSVFNATPRLSITKLSSIVTWTWPIHYFRH